MAFGVIVVTLIGQGLLLPSVVRRLGLARETAEERRREHSAEFAARSRALNLSQGRLEQFAADGRGSPEALAILRAHQAYRVGRLPANTAKAIDAASVAAALRAELIAAEREYIYRLLRTGEITDEARRRIERELDLEEAGIAGRNGGEAPL